MTIRMHKKVKITVLRTEYYQELAEQYAISYLGKCPFHKFNFLRNDIRSSYLVVLTEKCSNRKANITP